MSGPSNQDASRHSGERVFIGHTPQHELPAHAGATSRVIRGEPFVGITDVNAMPPFLMSIVSDGNVWTFLGSNGAFTSGRGDADHALFPYRTADKILAQPCGTGARTHLLVERDGGSALWEPWLGDAGLYRLRRHLFKSQLGTSAVFEEINEDLQLAITWTLTSSDKFGLVRFCELRNLGSQPVRVRYLDGFHQLLPAGVGQDLFERYSYLAAAYMRHECTNGLGIYTLNSGITDRAEPCEMLRVAAAWSYGHQNPVVLLSDRQIAAFRHGQAVTPETEVRGVFGAHLVCAATEISPDGAHEWFAVADTGLDHSALIQLRQQLAAPDALAEALRADVIATRDALRARIAAADGLQQTQDPASPHHFANVLFNCMRGGTLPDGYRFPVADLAAFLSVRNKHIYARHAAWLKSLPAQLDLAAAHTSAEATGDAHLVRLVREYLPITFSRRHGDPSRPWNRFSIRTRDEAGRTIYDYQGNWRDIFQNWESLAQSYPLCLESMIAVFLNASTADGYNPYRITRAGIDWEVEDPHDPWSHIGYWGDHQIIYLLRLLESLEDYAPSRLAQELNQRRFAYARVPYEIKSFAELLGNPRHGIRFNTTLHKELLARAAEIGNDAKLLADDNGEVRLVSLGEKLLVPLLAKLSNLVPGGGIWLNTQRPEWNDANNALAGWGLSMVTVGYLRRYLGFLERVLATSGETVWLSPAVEKFGQEICAALGNFNTSDDVVRLKTLTALGGAGENHRAAVYQGKLGEPRPVALAEIRRWLAAATHAVEETLKANRRADGTFHSYNLLELTGSAARVRHLNLMLEGQVAVLSSGLLSPTEALALFRALRKSDLFRADQHSYLLYPDRLVTPFLERNQWPADWQSKVPAIATLVKQGDRTVITVDASGAAHFNGDLTNAATLEARLAKLPTGATSEAERTVLLQIWEGVFQHSEFTGRSGAMFAFEGLGSIYWHMIAKLLLAAEECHRAAVASGAPAEVIAGLRDAYYDIRRGLGFTKSPEVYGAFPTDPYSHTPRHLGAQQPGMTGQVKEEILTRRAELGVRVERGQLVFAPTLLCRSEFSSKPQAFTYVDVNGAAQTLNLPAHSLAFTCCQVPVSYVIGNEFTITVTSRDGQTRTVRGARLSADDSTAIFTRTGEITRLSVTIPASALWERTQ
ncbi:MAG: hypothetical protein RLY20_211 [Verrucomicrobiota bacterium]|jgi:hypothetical protein